MSEIRKAARRITDEIDKSPEFLEYKQTLEAINADIPLKNKIFEFKKLSVAYAQKRANAAEVSFEEEKALGALYAQIILTEQGAKAFALEKLLFESLSQIYEAIANTEFSRMQGEWSE